MKLKLRKRRTKAEKAAFQPEYSGLSRQNRLYPYLMTGPAIGFLLVFVFYPMANMVRLSFYDYNLVSKAKPIGFENYRTLFFVRDDFRKALGNTAIYTIGVVFFLILFAVLLALWLDPDSFMNRLLQKAMFTPHLVAMLSVAYIWSWLFDVEAGLLNAAIQFVRLSPLRWLNDATLAIWCIVLVSVWKSLGYYLIIVLSSLRAIPSEIFEAADLDN
ncbi:MAG TPA: sugar ABC transporter permease, partial [Clostridiaceae bacterium]|nr:sugar ABC transporter permease [Clostridiaceae bacterium]